MLIRKSQYDLKAAEGFKVACDLKTSADLKSMAVIKAAEEAAAELKVAAVLKPPSKTASASSAAATSLADAILKAADLKLAGIEVPSEYKDNADFKAGLDARAVYESYAAAEDLRLAASRIKAVKCPAVKKNLFQDFFQSS